MKQLILLTIGMWLVSSPVFSATLFGIVSERSATELSAGAQQFLLKHPQHQLILRTPSQLAKIPDNKISAYLKKADAILLAAVFGDSTVRLTRLFKSTPINKQIPIFATNSDRRLTRLSRINGKIVFEGTSNQDLHILTRSPKHEIGRAHV